MPSRQYRREVYRTSRLVVDFEMDRPGMAKVARGPELRASVAIIAGKGKAYAESIAPHRTGNYARSFQVVMSRILIRGMRRISAKLVNTDPAATVIEVGSGNEGDAASSSRGTPAHRTLQKTLAYLGGIPTARGALETPTRGAGAPLVAIPTVAEFRERQRQQRERDRKYRKRRGRNWRGREGRTGLRE